MRRFSTDSIEQISPRRLIDGLQRRLTLTTSPTYRSHDARSHSLCKKCMTIIIDEQALGRDTPESTGPNGSVGLDLKQGHVDLRYRHQDLYPTLPLLSATAATGCKFCRVLLKSIEGDRKFRPEAWNSRFQTGRPVSVKLRYNCAAEIGTQSFGNGEWPTMLSSIEVCISPERISAGKPIIIGLKLFCDNGSPVADYLRIHRRPVQESTLSRKNLEMIRTWVRECASNHPACTRGRSSGVKIRPNRLIKIDHTGLGDYPRLVDTSTLEEIDIKYIALSYCWGTTSVRLTTTLETLADRMEGMPWNTLPLTYRDAIIVARELEIPYLWIDSLCIVQDEQYDWQQEAAKMGDIYRNAEITIAAVAASSTSDGFLRRTRPHEPVIIPFASSRHPNISGHYYVSYSGTHSDQEDFFRDVELSAWNKRGWTFQERLLSHRVLFFGSQMLHFECITLRRSEDYAGALKRNVRWHDLIQNRHPWSVLRPSWRALVHEYSSRSFTYRDDKLPALSSLANELATALHAAGDEAWYIAGLWTHDLCEELLWTSEPLPPEESKITGDRFASSSYIAPSWSWCSSSGVISWLQIQSSDNINCTFIIDCSIQEAHTTPSGSDAMGRVTAGVLCIQGPLLAEALAPGFKENDIADGKQYHTTHGDGQDLMIYFDQNIKPEVLQYIVTEGVVLALLCHTKGGRSLFDCLLGVRYGEYDKAYGLVLVPNREFTKPPPSIVTKEDIVVSSSSSDTTTTAAAAAATAADRTTTTTAPKKLARKESQVHEYRRVGAFQSSYFYTNFDNTYNRTYSLL